MPEARTYRRRPVEVEAIQVTENTLECAEAVAAWAADHAEDIEWIETEIGGDFWAVNVRVSYGGTCLAGPGDWVVWDGTECNVYPAGGFRQEFEEVAGNV